MARVSDHEKRDGLRKIILDAITEDLDFQGLTEEEMTHVYFMVSPSFDEVFAWANIHEYEIDYPAFRGWALEYAESIEQAMDIADLYFDLR